MTALIGASVLLIVASATALVFGWVTANESLIWTSITASVAAGVALALAFFRARQETAPVVATPETPAEAPASPTTAPDILSEEEAEVAGVRGSKRFHRPQCRYSGAKGAVPMTRSEAQRLGYRPCGICKP